MSDRGSLENLKQEIVENIYTNENQAVTGDLLQDVLIDAVDTMGVSVSQNTETGKKELLVGDTPVLIIDYAPEKNSRNPIESGAVFNESKNICDAIGWNVTEVSTTYADGLINSTGGVSSSVYAKHSDFVLIEPNKRYYLHSALAETWYIGFYSNNSEESFIRSTALPDSGSAIDYDIVIPSDAVYMRVTIQKAAGAFYQKELKNVEDNIGFKNRELGGAETSLLVQDENGNIATFLKDGYFHTKKGNGYASAPAFDFAIRDVNNYYLLAVKGRQVISRLDIGQAKKRIYITGNYDQNTVENIKLKHKNDIIIQIADIQQTFVDAAKRENCAIQKVIYICGPITYDMFEGMGGATWFAQMIEETGQGAYWGDYNALMENVHIIGLGKVKIKLDCTGYSNFIVSAINVKGNAIVENISIETMACRYPIHDQTIQNDSSTGKTIASLNGGKGTYRVYRNVKTKSESRGINSGYNGQTNVLIENCQLRCTSENTRYAYSYHEGNVHLAIINSVVDGGYFHSGASSYVVEIVNSLLNGDFNTGVESWPQVMGDIDYGIITVINSYVKNNIVTPVTYINRVLTYTEEQV